METEPIYQWSWVAQGVTVSVDVEGWDESDLVAYRATSYPLGSDLGYLSGLVSLSRSDRAESHGRTTHTAVIQNRGPFHPCAVDLCADVSPALDLSLQPAA